MINGEKYLAAQIDSILAQRGVSVTLVVFLGIALTTAVLILVELAARRLVRNSFVISLAGLALANAISQMNFPYLFVVFLIELSATLIVLGLLEHGIPRGRIVPTRITIRA